MTMSASTEYTYQMQVEDLARRANASSHKARSIIKAYRNVIKAQLYAGNKVEVPGLVTIYPSTRATGNEVFDLIIGLEAQLLLVENEVEYPSQEVDTLINTYLTLLKTKLDMGYEIRIAGVFLITPFKMGNGIIELSTRLSPALEKPESLTLYTPKVDGTIVEREVEKSKLIYRLILDSELEPPKTLHVPVEYIQENITFLDEDMFV